ncbi:MAG: hypothetical protein RR806_00680 [Oscillospiraceae bacterium]
MNIAFVGLLNGIYEVKYEAICQPFKTIAAVSGNDGGYSKK